MNEERHAYLILAHNNFYVLEKLLLLLDDERNDIYLHIDKKTKDFDFDHFSAIVKKSALIYPSERIDVKWGESSIVRAELLLFGEAFAHGGYSYYHLLSGADIPLKTQDHIHEFLSGRDECFIYYGSELNNYLYERLSLYHFWIGKDNVPANYTRAILYRLQRLFGVNRCKKIEKQGFKISKGGQWCSLPPAAVELLLQNRELILKMTRRALCPDEMYKQTVLSFGGMKINKNDLRCIGFVSTNPHPKTYTEKDYDFLISSDRFFARKFDVERSRAVVDMIFDHLTRSEAEDK